MRDLTLDATQLFVQGYVQTFLDNVVIESVQDVTRRWHQPERRLAEPVLAKDRRWEHSLYFTYSNYCVLYDPLDQLIKCWYEDLEGPPRVTGQHFGLFSRQLYAESADGVHWRKPSLDAYAVDGRQTNIVLGDRELGQVHSAHYIIDPHADTPEQRFRALYTRMRDGAAGSVSSTECAHSPDGIHWEPYSTPPTFGICGARLGDVSTLSYDEDAREFVHNTRHCRMGAGMLNIRNPRNVSSFNRPHQPHDWAALSHRRVFQCRSHDFIHWSQPILVAAADDEEDNLDESFYGMPQFKVGNVYLATVGVLHMVDNEMDVQLLMSRDGVRWKRTAKRRPFLAPRGTGHWDAHMVSIVSPPVELGGELWFFHGGTNYHHDWWLHGVREGLSHPETQHPEGAAYALGAAVLRKEGFAGLYSNPVREGIIVTHPLASDGDRLVINARCAPSGYVRGEVANQVDEVAPGYAREQCDVFAGDSTAHQVTWRGQADLPLFAEGSAVQVRKLRFFVRDAELFSFRFAKASEA